MSEAIESLAYSYDGDSIIDFSYDAAALSTHGIDLHANIITKEELTSSFDHVLSAASTPSSISTAPTTLLSPPATTRDTTIISENIKLRKEVQFLTNLLISHGIRIPTADSEASYSRQLIGAISGSDTCSSTGSSPSATSFLSRTRNNTTEDLFVMSCSDIGGIGMPFDGCASGDSSTPGMGEDLNDFDFIVPHDGSDLALGGMELYPSEVGGTFDSAWNLACMDTLARPISSKAICRSLGEELSIKEESKLIVNALMPPTGSKKRRFSATSCGDSVAIDSSKSGRWTKEEHRLFVQGLSECGRNWDAVARFVGTRSTIQIRSHAQKYFKKVARSKAEEAIMQAQALGLPNDVQKSAATAAAYRINISTSQQGSVNHAPPAKRVKLDTTTSDSFF